MSHALQISDDAFSKLQQTAAETGVSPESYVESMIGLIASTSGEQHHYEFDEWMRHLGMSDDDIDDIRSAVALDEDLDADA